MSILVGILERVPLSWLTHLRLFHNRPFSEDDKTEVGRACLRTFCLFMDYSLQSHVPYIRAGLQSLSSLYSCYQMSENTLHFDHTFYFYVLYQCNWNSSVCVCKQSLRWHGKLARRIKFLVYRCKKKKRYVIRSLLSHVRDFPVNNLVKKCSIFLYRYKLLNRILLKYEGIPNAKTYGC